jgi:putative drug exporter of the RND superfamily
MSRLALLALHRPRHVIAAAALFLVLAAGAALSVPERFTAGGFEDPGSESAQADAILANGFNRGTMQIVFTVTDQRGALTADARAVALDLVDRLRRSPAVSDVTSAWTAPPSAATTLVSRDGTVGLVIAGIVGDDNTAQRSAQELQGFARDSGGVTVRAGGAAAAAAQITEQAGRDLLVIELFAIPVSFVALVWVFGGMLAALLPVVVGVIAIAGSVAALRLAALATEVSSLALNVSVAMALALAIDYTLLIVSRYRDDVRDHGDREHALTHAMVTAGRTVLFSAATVGLSMSALLAFPIPMLRSFAYAGITAVTIGAAAAVVVTPAVMVLLGARLDAFDVRQWLRAHFGRPAQAVPVQRTAWYRGVRAVMRHAVPAGLLVVVGLLVVGSPFLHARWGFPDDRVLPASASARSVGEVLRSDFAVDPATDVSVVVPQADGLTNSDYAGFAARVSLLPDVASVSSPVGTFVDGFPAGPPVGPTAATSTHAFFTVRSTAPLFSDASEAQLAGIHRVEGPGGRSVLLSGPAQINRDTIDAIAARLPWTLGFVAMVTFLVLFALTGSVVLPLKALACNALSLCAAFGALVWVFQDGHLGGLGTATTGTLVPAVPVLLFCVAFGLSMDYEVFLLARVREHWLKSSQTAPDNTDSVAMGVASTARVITAAAVLMAVSFCAVAAAQVSIIRMFGVGLVLAVLVDATLVRMILVPSAMRVLGSANWWAPAPLARAHARLTR